MTRGFLLGKFMPLHQGHLMLIETAARLVDTLTVLVCTRACEPIDGDLRAAWMRVSVPEGVRIVHFTEDVPQEPADHPDFWPIWTAIVREAHPEPIDMVFGSEPYIEKLADCVSARPFLVDPDRRIVPVSATAIRSDPAANWAFIPPAVRPHYQRRFCLLGPESTGKSTLTRELATAFGMGYADEYGRHYDATFRNGTGWTEADFHTLADGHIALAETAAARSGPVFFEDTDLIQTMVWAEYLLGTPLPALAARLGPAHRAKRYLLLSPDVPWTDDGTRYAPDPETRRWFFDRLAALLQAHDLRFDVINGTDWPTRTTSASALVLAESRDAYQVDREGN